MNKISVRASKTDYSSVKGDPKSEKMLKLLEHYVKYDGDLMTPLWSVSGMMLTPPWCNMSLLPVNR